MDELLFSIDASFRKYGIVLEEKQKKQFEEYCNFLLEYNEKVNLTAITDRQEVIDMHFADSLAATNLKEIKTGALCADIGTGAGFPGVPLAIARPDITVALVDSLNKRLVFLNELKERLGLKNVYTVHGRSEDLGRDKNMRGKFDCVFSRAVARLNILLEYDIPFAKKDGYVTTMFGRRRPMPELKSSNFMQRSFGERVAMNAPIQGTAADIIKIAMIRVDQKLRMRGLRSRLILQVHDELLIETAKEELEEVRELLKEEMMHAADLRVRLEVDVHSGSNWYEAK